MRNICSVADVIMPNYTEAAFLADKYIDKDDVTRAQAEELVDSLRKMGSKSIVITSISSPTKGSATMLDAHSLRWNIPQLGVTSSESATLDFFIRQLADGYDTVLDENVSLSQGQRQLLAIARAAIADPPVLILDEATSSIDTRTERIVQQGMDNLMKGRLAMKGTYYQLYTGKLELS